MTEFEQANTAFLAWLAANGATVSKSIALQDYSAEGAGRGVIAVADINVNHERAIFRKRRYARQLLCGRTQHIWRLKH